MKTTYTYFCLFFIGSLLPLIMVEFYFQDFFIVGLLTILGAVTLTVCVSINYLKVKNKAKGELLIKKIDDLKPQQEKEKIAAEMSYYFRRFVR